MLDAKLYAPIFERKSIRKYDAEKPLSEEQLTTIQAAIANVAPLLPGETFQLRLAPAKEGWRIYGYCENTALSNVNLGFAMQQLDLALHLHGLGRVWFGLGFEPKAPPPGGLAYAMAMKVGNAAEPLAREHAAGFDRKASAEIIDDPALYALLEPVRLTPSAINEQPWRFTSEPGAIHVWRSMKFKGVKLAAKHLLRDHHGLIDIGAALCHAVLALEHAGKAFAVEAKAPARENAGCEYVLTLNII